MKHCLDEDKPLNMFLLILSYFTNENTQGFCFIQEQIQIYNVKF